MPRRDEGRQPLAAASEINAISSDVRIKPPSTWSGLRHAVERCAKLRARPSARDAGIVD